MAENYFPSAKDFDEMGDHLEAIATALLDEIYVDPYSSSWATVQKAVRAGVAPHVIPVGTKLRATHKVYGTIWCDVVAHNHYKSADYENVYTMTLMCSNAITSLPFDSREAFYYADEELPAGTYHFTVPTTCGSWLAGTYQFTLQYPLPAGGQLCIRDNSSTPLESSLVTAFINITDDFSTQSSGIVVGSDGANLGTFGVELNHINRVAYGSNNYKESDVRQFLNSSETMGYVWSPQTKFDRPPSWIISLDGFANGLDEDLLGVIGRVIVPCVANRYYESPDSTLELSEKYTLLDKFYLPSLTEMLGEAHSYDEDGSTQLPYFEDSPAVDRVKRDSIFVPRTYWSRNSYTKSECINHIIDTTGNNTIANAMNNHHVAPMFNIV